MLGVTGLVPCKARAISQLEALSARSGDQAPAPRLIYLSRPSVFFPSTHLIVGQSLFKQPSRSPSPASFATRIHLTPVILFLLLLWTGDWLLVLLSTLTIALHSLPPAPKTSTPYTLCRLAATTEIRPYVVNTYTSKLQQPHRYTLSRRQSLE